MSVTHRHGLYDWHVHPDEFPNHRRPLENEEIVASGEMPTTALTAVASVQIRRRAPEDVEQRNVACMIEDSATISTLLAANREITFEKERLDVELARANAMLSQLVDSVLVRHGRHLRGRCDCGVPLALAGQMRADWIEPWPTTAPQGTMGS